MEQGVGGGKILPKKAAVEDEAKASALDLWRKARQIKSTAIVATELTERQQRRQIPNKHAHTTRWDVDEVYRCGTLSCCRPSHFVTQILTCRWRPQRDLLAGPTFSSGGRWRRQ